MQKSLAIIMLVALCVITTTACKEEKYSETLKASILVNENEFFVKRLTITLASLIILAVVIYEHLLYRERKTRQILNLEINQLIIQHKELSEKYKNSLTSGIGEPMYSQDHLFLKKAIKIVEDNIEDPGFNVESMTKEIGMSRTNLHRKLKAVTGLPPGELIRNIRLDKAAALLLNQSESVSQICYTVGFEDHSYFSKAFKKRFGVPPSTYLRSKNLNN